MNTIIPYASDWRQLCIPRQSSTSELDESIAGEIYLAVKEEQDKEMLILRLNGLLRKYPVNENVYLILQSLLNIINNKEFANIALESIKNYIKNKQKSKENGEFVYDNYN